MDLRGDGIYSEQFWDLLKDSPALRFQLIELVEADSLRELADKWGYTERKSVWRYIRGPLRRRLEREAGGEVMKLLMLCLGEKGI